MRPIFLALVFALVGVSRLSAATFTETPSSTATPTNTPTSTITPSVTITITPTWTPATTLNDGIQTGGPFNTVSRQGGILQNTKAISFGETAGSYSTACFPLNKDSASPDVFIGACMAVSANGVSLSTGGSNLVVGLAWNAKTYVNGRVFIGRGIGVERGALAAGQIVGVGTIVAPDWAGRLSNVATALTQTVKYICMEKVTATTTAYLVNVVALR